MTLTIAGVGMSAILDRGWGRVTCAANTGTVAGESELRQSSTEDGDFSQHLFGGFPFPQVGVTAILVRGWGPQIADFLAVAIGK